MSNSAYIIDNGGYTVKAEISSAEVPLVIPNCVMKAKREKRRMFIGDQISECRDLSGLFYMLSFKKGYLSNLDIQKKVWDYIFQKHENQTNFKEIPVIVTEPYFNFRPIQEIMTEIFFEEYGCQSLLRINAGELSAYHYLHDTSDATCCIIVDSGYSFTHIVPYIYGVKFKEGMVRIDVGGKMLTNYLKDIISYRQLNVMEETYVINQVKEDACFVTRNLNKDMSIAQKKWPENTIIRDYILPDFNTLRRGRLRTLDKPVVPDFQTIRLANERFLVPEVLFHPSNIGVEQMGIAEAIKYSVSLCPQEARADLLNNIVLTGGNSSFEGYKHRVYYDLRTMLPEDYEMRVYMPNNPVTYAWHGGCLFSKDPDFYSAAITKEEYFEEGFSACYEKFNV